MFPSACTVSPDGIASETSYSLAHKISQFQSGKSSFCTREPFVRSSLSSVICGSRSIRPGFPGNSTSLLKWVCSASVSAQFLALAIPSYVSYTCPANVPSYCMLPFSTPFSTTIIIASRYSVPPLRYRLSAHSSEHNNIFWYIVSFRIQKYE